MTELVAAAQVHTVKRYGPDRIVGFSPIPAMSMASYAAGTRYLSMIGGTISSFYREACRVEPGPHDAAFTVALSVYGLRLSESGRHSEALTVTREALERQRELHRARPDGVDALVRIVGDFATVRLEARTETADARAAVDEAMPCSPPRPPTTPPGATTTSRSCAG